MFFAGTNFAGLRLWQLPEAAFAILIPSRLLPAVLETLATCPPAHQVQDTGGNPSTFLSADWRVKGRSLPQTCHSPGSPGGRHASDFPERWLPLGTWG